MASFQSPAPKPKPGLTEETHTLQKHDKLDLARTKRRLPVYQDCTLESSFFATQKKIDRGVEITPAEQDAYMQCLVERYRMR